MEGLNKIENLSGEKLLEQETGISSRILEKINKNPVLKKAFLALLFSYSLGNQANAQSAENIPNNTKETRTKNDSIFLKNLESTWVTVAPTKNEIPVYDPDTNPQNANEKSNNHLKVISESEVKKELHGYEQNPGDLTLEIILDKFKEYQFTITDPVVGETMAAASLSSGQVINNAHLTGQRYTFHKKLPNGNVSVIILVVHK